MSYYRFEACRVSGDGNAIFPDEIIIDDEQEVVIHRKPKIIGSKETKIRFGAIASVSCDKHILFADIYIETRGGREIVARGFTRDDAVKIVELLSF
ncbi:MAG: PH domain-containing protein [Bacteroidaceae bacterium]|nr:PH domain-containing protein [Bacteroidaceae bacterium]